VLLAVSVAYHYYDGSLMNNVQRIPPGMEFHHIAPHDADADTEVDGLKDSNANPDPPIWSEVQVTSIFSSF